MAAERCPTPGVGSIQPAGQVQPVKGFDWPADCIQLTVYNNSAREVLYFPTSGPPTGEVALTCPTQSNLDYSDLDIPDFPIICTLSMVMVFS